MQTPLVRTIVQVRLSGVTAFNAKAGRYVAVPR